MKRFTFEYKVYIAESKTTRTGNTDYCTGDDAADSQTAQNNMEEYIEDTFTGEIVTFELKAEEQW